VKLNNAVIGVVLLVFSITLMIHVSLGWDWLAGTGFTGFPRAVPGRPGPALFPFCLGILFAISSLLLIAQGLREATPWLELSAWFTSRPSLLNAVAIIAAVIAYQAASDALGFLPLAVLLLFGLMKLLRVRTLTAVITSAACALFIHTLFVKFLLVPLPWGVLEPLAW